jgi:excisionase family DNA binding protein
MESRLLKVPEVVELLAVSRAKVYELMASRQLRSVRVAGARRVTSEDLEAFIAGLDDNWPRAEHPNTYDRRGRWVG